MREGKQVGGQEQPPGGAKSGVMPGYGLRPAGGGMGCQSTLRGGQVTEGSTQGSMVAFGADLCTLSPKATPVPASVSLPSDCRQPAVTGSKHQLPSPGCPGTGIQGRARPPLSFTFPSLVSPPLNTVCLGCSCLQTLSLVSALTLSGATRGYACHVGFLCSERASR